MQSHRSLTMERRDRQGTEYNSAVDPAAVSGRKFMLTLRQSVFDQLIRVADQRGVTIQGLIRAVIVPEWHLEHPGPNMDPTVDTVSIDGDSAGKQSAPVEAWPRARGQEQNMGLRKIVGHN